VIGLELQHALYDTAEVAKLARRILDDAGIHETVEKPS